MNTLKEKAENIVSIWWLIFIGTIYVTYIHVIGSDDRSIKPADAFGIIFLINVYFIPSKFLCIYAGNNFRIFIGTIYQKFLLPLSSIYLPFFWASFAFGSLDRNGNLFANFELNNDKILFLFPLFILMYDPFNYIQKNMSLVLEVSENDQSSLYYFLLIQWVWIFPVLMK